MAIVQIQIANPTATDVTVNAKTAVARDVTQLGLDDATNEAYQFLAASCALLADTAAIGMREQSGFLIERLTQYK